METTILVPLSDSGLSARIDRADADLVAGFTWRPLVQKHNTYAHAWNGNMHVLMHRLVAGAGPKDLVDHANRDGLDNRKSNLRLATPSQNGANRVPDNRRKGRTSRYKGVAWDTNRSRWHAWIHVNGKTRSLGRFTDEDEAARKYDAAALEAWGEFARLNFPMEVSA